MTAALEVQIAMRTAWVGDSALSALVTGVFDGVPQKQALPYIAKGNSTEVPWTTFGPSEGKDVTMIWDVYWEGDGIDAGSAIIEAMNRLVHHKKLTLSNYVNVLTECDMWTLVTASIGDMSLYVNHAIVRYHTLNYPSN